MNEIERFASDNAINAMIINSQAFNAKGKDARRIYMELDEFRSRKPIDVIAKTNPILIIDEPQSVEGPKTKEGLKNLILYLYCVILLHIKKIVFIIWFIASMQWKLIIKNW